MNNLPPGSDPPDDADNRYRRASALDPSRPSEAVRRAVLAHAAELVEPRKHVAAAPSALSGAPRAARGAPRRHWQRPALFGGLAAAALAGLLLLPRWLMPLAPPAQAPLTSASANLAAAPQRAPGESVAAPAASEAPAPAALPANAAPANPLPARAPYVAQRAREGSGAQHNTAQTDAAKSIEQETVIASGAPSAGSPAPAASSAGASRAAAASAFTRAADPAAALRRAAAAGDVRTVQSLLHGQADINARDSQGRTVLFLAAQHGQADVVRTLLEHGADPNLADAEGATALQAARDADQSAIAALLEHYGAH